MLGWSGKHKIDQQTRTVSVWDQLLKGLKGVLIQETFYGVEKGTNIIKMILEQGNFSWPGYNSGMRQPQGKPCWEAVCCRGRCEHRGDGMGALGGVT